ncbi:MAG: hypothetical protein NPIRA05_21290 [Nitrospirales bacterium]|nr:MAG: hypothetical protein NPIRA05_21290 [Nitrospirales bacterium]
MAAGAPACPKASCCPQLASLYIGNRVDNNRLERGQGQAMGRFLIWGTVIILAAVGLYSVLNYNTLSETNVARNGCSDLDGQAQVDSCTWLLENDTTLDDAHLASVFLNRANGFTDIGELDNALVDYSESVSVNPDDFKTYYNRALVYRWKGDYSKALADHTKSISLFDKHPALFRERAETLYMAQRYEESLPDIKRALKLDPNNAATLNSMAWTLLTLGRAEEALDYSKRSLENDKEKFSGSLDTYAHVMAELGRKEEAMNYFLKAARIGDTYYVRGLQEALIEKGLYDAVPDGILSSATRAAIQACVDSNCRLLLETP